MASSTGSLDHGGGGFTFTPPSFITSFTDLLSSAAGDVLGGDSPRGMFPRSGGNGGVPKFKSAQPPSLPISAQPPMSPSSYFAIPAGLSPAELLDSPVLLTSANNVLASPTTGAIPAQRFDWKRAADMIASQQQQQESRADFSFPSFNNNNDDDTLAVVQQQQQEQQQAAPEAKQSGVASSNKLEDGYNWRKYGQKQVKGSENPRSYYKCTHHSCSMKKKVERSLADGRVTQIVYKGAHNHPKPFSTRRNSSSSAGGAGEDQQQQQQQQAGVNGNSTLSENSSVTFGDDDADNGGGSRLSDEPDAKRWKEDGDNEGISSGGPGGKAVREPRLVVQTLSDIDILDDGFRWRKYGQKVVKGNPNPRSYYKCTTAGCPVRKHVERASHDPRAVITAYEGKHNHDVPVGRGAGAASRAPPAAAPTTHHNHPYTLEMMHTSSGYGYGAFQQQQQQRAVTKDEPRDDLFVDSLLC